MENSRRTLFNDMIEHMPTLKINQNPYYPRFAFTPKTGMAFPERGFRFYSVNVKFQIKACRLSNFTVAKRWLNNSNMICIPFWSYAVSCRTSQAKDVSLKILPKKKKLYNLNKVKFDVFSWLPTYGYGYAHFPQLHCTCFILQTTVRAARNLI